MKIVTDDKKNICRLLLLYVLIFWISVYNGLGQEKENPFVAKNSIYADFASKGAFYSINYDRIFYQGNKLTFSYRLGFSVLEDAIAIPVGVNLYTGKGNSHLEYSLTLIPYVDHYKSFLSSNDLSDKYLYVVPGIGYRYQRPQGGFFFKVVLSPTVFLDPPSSNFWKMDPKFYITANIGLGYSF